MSPRLRFLLGLVAIGVISIFNLGIISAAEDDKYFVVTAYYSPLPGQSEYSYSSYLGRYRNYQEAIALQGKGTHGASGTPVFKGMLAGPKNYPFGTKVYLEGFGVGEITDRGGAIRAAGGSSKCVHDCIDIWVGYGDEGRIRAQQWGVRTIKGGIVASDTPVSIDFPESDITTLTKLNINPENSSESDVSKLQEIFTKIDLYNGEIDGKYESIKNELIEFQLKAGIIQSKSDESAGWYGPKTLAALREQYGDKTAALVEKPIEEFELLDSNTSIQYKIILEYGDLEVSPESNSKDIQKLQELLKKLGEYSGKIDGKYSSVENTLINLQIKTGVISNKDDWGAGYFGDKTKTALGDYYDSDDFINNVSSTSYRLNQIEKEQITAALNLIKVRLKKIEDRGGRTVEARLSGLKKQIDEVQESVQDPIIKAKIVYLSEIL